MVFGALGLKGILGRNCATRGLMPPVAEFTKTSVALVAALAAIAGEEEQ